MSLFRRLAADRLVQAALAIHLFALVVLGLSERDPTGGASTILPLVDPLIPAMVLVALLAGRSQHRDARERHFWDLLAAAWLCWLTVEFFYFFEPPVPFISASFAADTLYVLFYLCFALALELKPHLRQRPSLQLRRRRLESTGALLAVFGLLIYFALIVLPEPLGLSLGFVARDRGLVPYLLMRFSLDLFLLGRLVYGVFSSSGHWPRIYGFLSAAMLGYTLRDAVLLLQVRELLGTASFWFGWTAFLMLPSLLVVLAVRYRHRAPPSAPGAEIEGEPSTEGLPRISFLAAYMLVVPGLHFISYPLGLLDESSRGARELFCLVYLLATGTIAILHQKATETDRNRAIESLQREVTERNRVNRELQLRQAEMEQFSYTISHELKAPLVTILAFLDLLEKGIESGDARLAKEDLGRIRGAATSMSRLLVELLELSRVGWVLEREAGISMTSVAESARQKLATEIEKSNSVVSISSSMPDVQGDAARLEDVFTNLLTNAVKFGRAGRTPRIRVDWRPHNPPVFFVSDNGRGIEARYHEKIFGLFDRLDPRIQGTGVGLTLVKRIVERHGGSTWVESEGTDRGSTFCFTVPDPSQPYNGTEDSR